MKTALILVTITVALSSTAVCQDGQLPNIILCMGDDHGWEETGYYGHPAVLTPTLDEMAASGLRLDRFYAAHPTCSPTRGSVLTGRHPNRYGTFTPNCSIRPEEITIAQVLQQAGYMAGHFGKWHLGPVKATSPTNPGAMGFDQWVSHDNFFELNPVLSRNGAAPKRLEGESSAVVVEETIRFIKEAQAKQKPFLAVVWFGSPHEPYSGLAGDLALYDDLPKELSQREVKLTSNTTGRPTQRPLRDVLRERYAEITAMDRAMGALRSFLAEEGLRNNTLLWYCGDNGTPPSGVWASPLRGRKATLYEGGIRVPGLIEWPARISQSRVSQVPAVTSDILPTICSLIGRETPDRPLDGIDLMPLIDGRMETRPEPIYFWSFASSGGKNSEREPYIDPELQRGTTPLVKLMNGIATRNFVNYRHPEVTESDFQGTRVALHNDWKLILHDGPELKSELFHLGEDPAEANNLAEAESDRVKAMRDGLRAWQESVLRSLTEADYR